MTSVQIAPNVTGIPAAKDYRMLVNGDWVEARDGRWIEITTPIVRGHVIGRVPSADVADVDDAVAAARAAFPAWRAQHFTARQRALGRVADAIEARLEDLAVLTALDTGTRFAPRPDQRLPHWRICSGISPGSPGKPKA